MHLYNFNYYLMPNLNVCTVLCYKNKINFQNTKNNNKKNQNTEKSLSGNEAICFEVFYSFKIKKPTQSILDGI